MPEIYVLWHFAYILVPSEIIHPFLKKFYLLTELFGISTSKNKSLKELQMLRRRIKGKPGDAI